MQLVIMNPFFLVKYCVIPLLYSLQEKERTMIMKYNIPYTAVSRKVVEKKQLIVHATALKGILGSFRENSIVVRCTPDLMEFLLYAKLTFNSKLDEK